MKIPLPSTSSPSGSHRRWILPAALLLAAAAGLSFAEAPEPADDDTGDEVVVIPGDWRGVYPFSARFPDLPEKSVHGPILDLAAVRFATGALVVDDGKGGRRMRRPDLSSFPPELIREPFAESASDLFVVQAASPERQLELRAELDDLGIDVRGYLPRHAYLDVDGSPILHGGRVYVGTNSGHVHALDATGAELWTAPFDAADGPVKGYPWPR